MRVRLSLYIGCVLVTMVILACSGGGGSGGGGGVSAADIDQRFADEALQQSLDHVVHACETVTCPFASIPQSTEMRGTVEETVCSHNCVGIGMETGNGFEVRQFFMVLGWQKPMGGSYGDVTPFTVLPLENLCGPPDF